MRHHVGGRYHARSPARAGPNAVLRTDSMSIRGPLAMSLALVCAAQGVLAQSPAVETRSIESVRGCELRYRVHRPSAPKAGPVVLIGHGFMRDGTNMQGWADAFTDAASSSVVA